MFEFSTRSFLAALQDPDQFICFSQHFQSCRVASKSPEADLLTVGDLDVHYKLLRGDAILALLVGRAVSDWPHGEAESVFSCRETLEQVQDVLAGFCKGGEITASAIEKRCVLDNFCEHARRGSAGCAVLLPGPLCAYNMPPACQCPRGPLRVPRGSSGPLESPRDRSFALPG